MESAYLFLDGLSPTYIQVIEKQLLIVSRINANTQILRYHWQMTHLPDQADALCLDEGFKCSLPQGCNHPILSPLSHIASDQLIPIVFPCTTVMLMEALKSAEQLMAQKDNISNIAMAAPPLIEAVQQKQVDDSSMLEKFSLSAYLGKPSSCNLTVQWAQDMVWFDRDNQTVYSTAKDAPQTAKLFIDEPPISVEVVNLSAGNFDSNLQVLSEQSILWSYGLHAPPSDSFLEKYHTDKQKFKLKKWPLFGQWETRSDLLFLTTMFAQKFSSLSEVVAKTGKTPAEIVRFLSAAELAGIPIETEGVSENDAFALEGKKEIIWINRLRDKLHMNDFL